MVDKIQHGAPEKAKRTTASVLLAAVAIGLSLFVALVIVASRQRFVRMFEPRSLAPARERTVCEAPPSSERHTRTKNNFPVPQIRTARAMPPERTRVVAALLSRCRFVVPAACGGQQDQDNAEGHQHSGDDVRQFDLCF